MSFIESFGVIIKTGALEEGYTPDPPNPHEEHDGTEEDERPAELDDGCDYLLGGARGDVGDTLARNARIVFGTAICGERHRFLNRKAEGGRQRLPNSRAGH